MTIYKSDDNSFRRILREVVGDSVRWSEIWASLTAGHNPPSPLPEVDFHRNVLLVAVGPALGTGDSVIIRHVLRTGQAVKVIVMSYRQCLPLDVVNVPVHVVQVRRPITSLRFQEDLTTGPIISYEKKGVEAYLLDYPLPHGPRRLIKTLNNTVVNSVAISEDGTQLIVNEGMKHESWDALPAGPEGCSPVQPGIFGFCNIANYTESNASCMVTYRSFATGDIIEPSIPARYACELPVGASAAWRGGRRLLKAPRTH